MLAVKQKLKNTKLIQNCQIIRQVEKGMTNKEALEKFGVPKNTIYTWMKNKDKLFDGLKQSSSDAKKCEVVIMNKWAKLFLNVFLFKEAKTFGLMA